MVIVVMNFALWYLDFMNLSAVQDWQQCLIIFSVELAKNPTFFDKFLFSPVEFSSGFLHFNQDWI